MEEFNNEILDEFLKIETDRQLASILKIPYKTLKYNLHILPKEDKYKVFEIKKKNGGTRKICAPISGIKFVQKNLAIILNHLHNPKYCVHGYVKEKSIKTNAEVHLKKRIIINIDLKDFFSSINFGRVRGLFKSYPFNFNDSISTILAQICCYDGCLPQGAPSSPVLSNYICYRLDNQILHLSRKYKVDYTRYADDITFSTNLKELPKEIGVIKDNIFSLSKELIDIIESNGFTINNDKIRYALRNNRQEVTGLIVNTRLNVNRKYVRHVRAIIHAWEKFGIEAAAIEHFDKFNYKNKIVSDHINSFIKEITGKVGYIGHIKGKNNSVYRNLFKRIKALIPEIKLPVPPDNIDTNSPIVFCEGKTDGIHLGTALSNFKNKGEFLDLNIIFHPYEEGVEINNDVLLKIVQTRHPHKKRSDRVEIYLFDRDVPNLNNKVSQPSVLYKAWGKNIYSLLLPIPVHRNFDEICIEQFYTDDEIKTETKNGWRLYLSSEFDQNTGNHLTETGILYTNLSYLKAPYPRILDSKVIKHSNGKNIALSKKIFAENIANGKGEFKNISLENFRIVFELFREILKDTENV